MKIVTASIDHIHRHPSLIQTGALLVACGLPADDLNTLNLKYFFGYSQTDTLQAVVGLEKHGTVALLRSLAVAQAYRGRGYGSVLVTAAEREARLQGITTLYLLTFSAADFFSRLGYVQIDRMDAPDVIKTTQQFTQLCPDSAILMVKWLLR